MIDFKEFAMNECGVEGIGGIVLQVRGRGNIPVTAAPRDVSR